MDNQLKDDILTKTPKSFDSNKLINPDIIIDDDEYDDDDDEEEPIDEGITEIDNETLDIINKIRMKKLNTDNVFNFSDNKTIKKTPKKENKKISFLEFTKIVEAESKPIIKKFSSRRVENKKNQFENTIISKRQFNPRKPPYNFTRKISTTNIPEYNNIQEFPQLK